MDLNRISVCILLALALPGFEVVHGDLLPVTTDRLHKHLKVAFGHKRNHLQPDIINITRNYIKEFLSELAQNHSTSLIEMGFDNQQRTCGNSSCPGVNYLWVLPGTRFGTPEDRVYLLGTHYDTVPNSPGVDDNGSGMSAMLETARILSQSALTCQRLNSLAFVAFDWEEYYLLGSKKFLEQIGALTAELQITPENFMGAVVMDTVMNWNNSQGSQVLPMGYDQVFPEVYSKLEREGYRGNFLNMLQRVDDVKIGNGLKEVWSQLAGSKYGAENLVLPPQLKGKVSTWPREIAQNFYDFLRSDHTNFWDFATPDNMGLKAIFLTDSANFRGVMTKCYHQECDDLSQVTPEKLEFLAKVTEMLVRYHLKMTMEKDPKECGGPAQDKWSVGASGPPVLGGSIFWLLAVTCLMLCENVQNYC